MAGKRRAASRLPRRPRISRSLHLPRMPCRAIGKRRSKPAVTITTPNRLRCRACSKKSMHSSCEREDNHAPRRDEIEPNQRLERALAAFVRQEFGAPIATITGLTEILIEDARRSRDEPLASDLGRIHSAGVQLQDQLSQVVGLATQGSSRATGDFAPVKAE